MKIYLYKILSVIMIFSLMACKDGGKKQPKNSEVSDQNNLGKNIDIGFQNLKLNGKLIKFDTQDSSKKKSNDNVCEDWILREQNLEGILANMIKVEGVEWNALCYTLPCYYEGKVDNDKKQYTININGASHIRLYNDQETHYFIFKEKSKIFPLPCDCCE